MHDFPYQDDSSAHIPCIALLLKDEIKQNGLRRHLHQRKDRLWGVEETLREHVLLTWVQSRALLCFSPPAVAMSSCVRLRRMVTPSSGPCVNADDVGRKCPL